MTASPFLFFPFSLALPSPPPVFTHHMAPSRPSSSSVPRDSLAGTLMSTTLATNTIIPGLPDDLAAIILCLLPLPDQSRLRATSRAWRLLLSASSLLQLRRSLRLPRRHLLCLFPSDPSLSFPLLIDPSSPTTWAPLPPLPCSPQLYGLANFSPLAIGHHLYLLGGSQFDARSYPLGHPSPSAAAYRIDLALAHPRWERLPSMRFPRGSFACAATASGGVLVAGGGSRHPMYPSDGSRTSAFEWYDPTAHAWHSAEPMPHERAGCIGFVARSADGQEDEFWVMGGYGGYTTVSGVVPNDVYCRDAVAYGLRSGKWREVGNMWEEEERQRLGPVASISGEGGRASEVFMLDCNDVCRYDLGSNRWLKESTLRRRIQDTELCGFAAVNGELCVLTSAKVPLEVPDLRKPVKKRLPLELQLYNPEIKKWRILTAILPLNQSIDFRTAALCTIEM